MTVGYASSAIANGTVDEDDKFAVGLGMAYQWQGQRGIFGHCSGSLIAPNLVLTARHCIAETTQGYVNCGSSPFGSNYPPQALYVTTDTRNNANANWTGVRKVVTPTTGNDTCGFDVALLILQSSIPASVATPINPRIDSPPERGDLYTAIGYGATCDQQGGRNAPPCEQGPAGIRRRQDGLKVQCTRGKCSPSSQVKSTEWNGEKDVCSGDSGGPALDSLGRVIGVASRGGGVNGQCVYPIYAGVDSWRDLIIETALEAAEVGGYEAPKWATTGDSTQDLPPFDPGTPPDTGGTGGSGGSDGDDSPDAGEPPVSNDGGDLSCASHDDCGEGEICAEGVCVASCTANPCDEGNICNADTGVCEVTTHGDPSGDAVDDVSSSWSCSIGHSTDPTKPVPWLIGLAMIPVLRRLRARRS